jgi:hypothetical protein
MGDKMKKLGRMVLLVAGVAAVGATGLAAQSQDREGAYASLGLGYGTAGVDCDQCGDTSREGSVTGYFELGLSLSDMFLMAAMGNGWYKSVDGSKVTIGVIGLSLRFYPLDDAGFFIKGGAGSSYIDAALSSNSNDTKWAFGWLLGGGYDIPLGDTTALTFLVTVFGGSFGNIGNVTGVSTNVISGTVGFSAF